MPFVKGKSGNPGGAGRDKPWADALRLALAELEPDGSGHKKLRKVADALIAKARDGDVAAAREIGDRLDGKAVQALANEDGGPLQISIIRFTGGET